MNSFDPLSAGITALDAGDDREARRLLGQAVRQNPEDVEAWWHLADVMADPAQKAHCLRQVLRLQPDHMAAAELLRDAERRIASPTPAYGWPRPVMDVAVESAMTGSQAKSVKSTTQRSRIWRVGLALVVSIALIAVMVVASFVLLPGRDRNENPQQPISVRIGVPSCTISQTQGTHLLFVNQSAQPVQLYRGDLGGEEFLGSIAPGSELNIEAASDVRFRYAVRTKDMSMTEGAILEVPSNNSCRVPIVGP